MTKNFRHPIFDVLPPRNRGARRHVDDQEKIEDDVGKEVEGLFQGDDSGREKTSVPTDVTPTEDIETNGEEVEIEVESRKNDSDDDAHDDFLHKLAKDKAQTPSLGSIPARSRRLKVFFGVLIGIAIIFGGAWWVAANLARGTVTLVTDRSFTPFSFGVELGKTVESPDWTIGRLPLQVLTRTTNQEVKHSATGETEVSAHARGQVVIHNGLASSQRLVLRTRLQSQDGKMFRLAEPIVIPANGSARAEVIAENLGGDYNIGPSRFTIPAFREQGLLERFEKIYGESTVPFRGGALGKTTVVSEADIRAAKEEVSRKAIDFLGEDLRQAVPEGFILLEQGGVRTIVNNISADAKVGEVRESFSAITNVTIEALVFDERYIATMARREIQNEELFEVWPNAVFNFSYALARPADFARGALGLVVDGSLNVGKSIDVEAMRQAIVGKHETEVQRKILALPGIKEASVVLWPQWARRFPSTPEQIKIEVK